MIPSPQTFRALYGESLPDTTGLLWRNGTPYVRINGRVTAIRDSAFWEHVSQETNDMARQRLCSLAAIADAPCAFRHDVERNEMGRFDVM